MLLVVFSGCSRGVELFSLRHNDDPGAAIGITERPAQDAPEEGYFLPDTNSTPDYRLRRPAEIDGRGEVWAFEFTALRQGVLISLLDGEGNLVAGRSVSTRPADAMDLAVAVAVPAGARVESFRVALRDDPGSAAEESAADETPAARLVGVLRAVSDDRWLGAIALPNAPGGLTVGTGVVVDAWGRADGAETLWSVTPAEGGPWDPARQFVIGYEYTPAGADAADDGAGPPDSPTVPTVELAVGERRYSLAVRPGENEVVFHPGAEGVQPGAITIRSSLPGLHVTRVAPAARTAPGAPLDADLGTILRYPRDAWREPAYELFRWSLYPDVLVFDTRDYEVQARFFKRLAFFVEKEGFRGQLLTDAELAGRHGYNAHNYNGEGLAAFFTAAQAAGFALTEEEELLRGIVLREGIIVRSGDGYAAGRGGLLSISQESWSIAGLRELLVTHEAYHGVFYSDQEYVDGVAEIWNGLSEPERRFWALLLDGMQYDVTDTYLVVNEFQAYLLQQSVANARWYFEVRSADRLRRWKPGEAAWVDNFLVEYRGALPEQVRGVNALLFAESGLVAGDVTCLMPL
jgi:hypothetical protein